MLKKATTSLNPAARAAALGVAAFVAATSATRPAFAADVTFPNSDSSGDLASAAAWGGTLPAATDRPKFTTSGQTFTASADIAFSGLYFSLANSSAVTVTLDMTDESTGGSPRAITLGDGIVSQRSGSNDKAYTAWLKGGRWDVTGGLSSGEYGGQIKVTDGAEMTLSGNIAPRAGGNNASFVFSGEGTTVSGARANLQTIGGGASNYLRVEDGAMLSLTGGDSSTAAFQTGHTAGDGCHVIVTGAGSKLKTTESAAPVWVGNANNNHYISVEDGGALSVAGTLVVGRNATSTYSGHYVLAKTGGTIDAKNVILGSNNSGGNATARNFRFIVDGATATVSGTFHVGGNASYYTCGTALLVTNGATFACHKFPVIGAKSGSTGNLVRIAGANTVFEAYTNQSATVCQIFDRAKGNRFEIVEGAKWTNNVASATYVSYAAYSEGGNTFRIADGAEFHTSGSFRMNSIHYTSASNRVEVCDGARLYSSGSIDCRSYGNVLAITNGVVETDGNLTITAGNENTTNIPKNKDNELAVAGATGCVVASSGAVSIDRESTLRFGYPVDGYAAGVVPVRAKAFEISSDSAIVVDGVAERVANPALKETETVTLIETENGATIPDAVLAAANARLPERCALRKSADGKSLLFKVAKDSVTVVIMR